MEILFITANRVGDAALTTGLYDRLAETCPDARFTVACGPLAAPLFAAAPGLTRLIAMPKRRFAGHWLDLWRQVAGRRWDLVVDLRDSAVSRLILARRRLILRPPPKHAPPRHKVATLADLLGADLLGAGLLGADPPPAPRLWLSAAAQAEADRLLGPVAAGDGRPLLALAPAANWIGKEWPAERFIEVARRLTAPKGPLPGARPLVLASAAEAPRARPVAQALADLGAVDLIGVGDLATSAACIARAGLFIGNDSGLMHIAAAAGVPTLGLFGPGYPEIYGPWGKNAAVVVSAVPAEELRARVTPQNKSPPGLMDGVSVDAVAAAAARLLADKTVS